MRALCKLTWLLVCAGSGVALGNVLLGHAVLP